MGSNENIFSQMGDLPKLMKDYNAINDKFSDPDLDPDEMNKLIEKQGELQEKIEALGGWEVDQKIELVIDALRCPDGDSAVTHLSGGEKRRVALARLIMSNPDILLLDEPTAGLDRATEKLIVDRLLDSCAQKTLIVATHSLELLQRLDRIVVIEKGRVIADSQVLRIGQNEFLLISHGCAAATIPRPTTARASTN